MYYASLLLISHGDGVLQDSEWLQKVESFKSTLERFTSRWKIAGRLLLVFAYVERLNADYMRYKERYVESINIALANRLGAPMQM